MKSFSQYVHTRFNEDAAVGAIDRPDSSPSGYPNTPADNLPDSNKVEDDSDDTLNKAIKVAIKKYRSQVEKFLNKLAESDSEIKNALGDNGQYPIPQSDDNGGETLMPPMSDMG